MLIAVEHLGNVGVGVTAPQFFRANDEKVYVVKLQKNRLGSKVLVSELLAAKLGIIMGLCFPPSDIIEINEELLRESPQLTESGAVPGRHFASQYMDSSVYLGKYDLNKIVNVAEMAGVILFDHIFHNADRTNNRKNLIMRQEEEGYKVYAIDNSHLFRSGKWTLESLDTLGTKLKVYYHYSFGVLLKDRLSPQDFIPYMEKVKKLSNEQIESIVRQIPDEWLSDMAEREGLVNYISIRRDMVEEIWHDLCKYIPKTRGGYRRLKGKIFGSHRKKSKEIED